MLSNYSIKNTLFLLFLLFATLYSCKNQQIEKITHYTFKSTGEQLAANDQNGIIKKDGSSAISYYAGSNGNCSGFISYQFGWVMVNAGYSDEFVEEFKLLIRSKLEVILNQDVKGSFFVHKSRSDISFTGVENMDMLPIESKIREAFIAAASEKSMSVRMDQSNDLFIL